MKGQNVILARPKSDEWSTPQNLYCKLDSEFHFTLDPCSDGTNAKCSRYYTMQDNGLSKQWRGEVVFMNPPYSDIKTWMRKAASESLVGNTNVVCLIPSRTDTKWWHSYVMGVADEIRFIKGRLKFGDSKNSAPFPSAIVVYRSYPVYERTFLSSLDLGTLSKIV